MRYAIRRVSPFGALLYGLVLGLIGWLIPGVILGWLARTAVLSLRQWLDTLQFTIPLPFGEGIAIDLTSALSLSETQARLAALAGQEAALVLAIALGTAAAGMLLTGLFAFFGAVFYNLFAGLFGGIEVSLDALDAPAARKKAPVAATTSTAAVPTATVATAAAVAPPPVIAARPRPEPTAPRPTAWLTSAGGENLALRDGVTRFGSAPENDVVLTGLAPNHAEIRRESGRYLIYDLGSRRTWVNDVQVAAVHMLKDGFRLQMGQAEFAVHIPATNTNSVEER